MDYVIQHGPILDLALSHQQRFQPSQCLPEAARADLLRRVGIASLEHRPQGVIGRGAHAARGFPLLLDRFYQPILQDDR